MEETMVSYCLKGMEFQFCKRQIVLTIGGNDCTTTRMYLALKTVHLKIPKMVNFILCIFHYNLKKYPKHHNPSLLFLFRYYRSLPMQIDKKNRLKPNR